VCVPSQHFILIQENCDNLGKLNLLKKLHRDITNSYTYYEWWIYPALLGKYTNRQIAGC
jgi:hypothetical protein